MEARQIPGFPEIVDWPVAPTRPLTVRDAQQWRCWGPGGPPSYVVIEDANRLPFIFCFDRYLGRLCYGATKDHAEQTVFVRVGSPLEAEVLPLMARAARQTPDWDWLTAVVRRAAERSPVWPKVANDVDPKPVPSEGRKT